MSEADQNMPAKSTDKNATDTKSTFVKDGDIKMLIVVGLAAMSVLLAFGWFLHALGFLHFPSSTGPLENRDYLTDTLLYRERRMAMSLLMRTFLIGFSFVVGMALCTMGGLFILRQVSSNSDFSARSGAVGGTPGMGLSFSSYSPGVMFMVGGVIIVGMTQYLAIPIRGVEIIPSGTVGLCPNPDTGKLQSCSNLAAPKNSDQTSDTLPATNSQEHNGNEDNRHYPQLAQVELATAPLEALAAPVPEPLERISRLISITDLKQLSLPENIEITRVAVYDVEVSVNDKTLMLPVSELHFERPDWGIGDKVDANN